MGSKVTVSVADDATHSFRAVRQSTTTGQGFEAREVAPGNSVDLDVGDDQQIMIVRSQAAEAPAEEQVEKESTTKKK